MLTEGNAGVLRSPKFFSNFQRPCLRAAKELPTDTYSRMLMSLVCLMDKIVLELFECETNSGL